MDSTTPAALGFPLPEVHAIDASRYDEATNTYWCDRCQRAVDAIRWARPCPGLPGGVRFHDLFDSKPGGEGANHLGDSRSVGSSTDVAESLSPSSN